MRISVECGGYAEAAATCRTANHLAALLTESLAGKLSGYAGMAGDDATSRDFASSYDAGAREALAALTDLTHAHISMGRLIDACGNRHATADASAAGLPTNAYVGTSLDEDSYARVSPDVPPSSVGPQEPALSRVDAWILDQVEGFLWPGADVDLLRDAAATWRRTSESVADLTDHHRIVADLLARQRSPEIPLAIETIGELRGLVLDVADQLASLASACEDYAAAVADARDRTRALLTEIAQMVVEEVTVTAIVAGITGGLGGSAKAAAAVARIRAQAPPLPRPSHHTPRCRRGRSVAPACRRGTAAAGAGLTDQVRSQAGARRARLIRSAGRRSDLARGAGAPWRTRDFTARRDVGGRPRCASSIRATPLCLVLH